jgi:eukaryotic-like serine/threonine-protein kinase
MGLLNKLRSAFATNRLDVKSRYELMREAISGTMSKFYMARDRRTGQIVGLKLLHPEKTAAFEARFKGLNKPSEGEIAVRLRHANIVETYEQGVTTDGTAYLVMEFLPGPGMNSMLVGRDKRLDGHRVGFIRQAAEAVAGVHAAGFIHRDICPRNLILAADGETLKLIDFGLTIPAQEPFLQPGNRTGNPNYMAPEIVRRRPTDCRVDVFAFGVTAYEICTYNLPWQLGTNGQAAMAHEHPPTDIRRYRPQILPELAKAIHWCIEPDVQKRCPSIDEFLQAIQGIEYEDCPVRG